MTIIVTGGAGFIGSNFIFHMLGKYPEYRIVCLDKLTYAGNLSTLKDVMDNPNFRFVRADICDREAVYRLFEEEHPDIVVNFAAESHVDRSIEDPGIFLQTNILGTATLMDACRKYHGRDADPYVQPVFQLEGGGGPAGDGVPPDLWAAVHDLAVLEQLWAVSLPGEADSPDDRQRSER